MADSGQSRKDGSQQKNKKELRHSASGLRIVCTNEEMASPFLLPEPHWTPDAEVPICQKCSKTFDFLNRRHHCRRCGRIFCSKDCNIKLLLPRMSFVDPVRVCDACATVTRKENEFFEKHLKTLSNGATFLVTSSSTDDPNAERQFFCKLTVSHRHLDLQSPEFSHTSILISSISKAQILQTQPNTGSSTINGMTLNYTNDNGTEHSLTLKVKPESQKKIGIAWVVALQKGVKMIFEGNSQSND